MDPNSNYLLDKYDLYMGQISFLCEISISVVCARGIFYLFTATSQPFNWRYNIRVKEGI
jgi:hypothetical protein